MDDVGLQTRRGNESEGVTARVRIDGRSVTVTVLEAIAESKGKTVNELEFRLYDYVDPEALNSLYNHSIQRNRGSWKFVFAIDDTRVTIDSDGEVIVY